MSSLDFVVGQKIISDDFSGVGFRVVFVTDWVLSI